MIKNFFEINKIDFHDNFMPEDLLIKLDLFKHSNSGKIQGIDSMIDLVRKFEVVLGHRMIASTQRNSYNLQRKNKESLKKQIMIEVDFKQKIAIGISPRQVNKEYYTQELRTCLGFGVTHVNSADEIETINFDVIANKDDKQDAMAAVRGFRILRSQEFFKRIDSKNYKIWADCGKHFRNLTLTGYFFKELSKEGILGSCFHYKNFLINCFYSVLLLNYCSRFELLWGQAWQKFKRCSFFLYFKIYP